jgi:competence protein ComEA
MQCKIHGGNTMLNLKNKLNSLVMFSSKLLFAVVTTICATGILLSTEVYATDKSEKGQQEIATLTVNINKASAEEIADVLTGVGIKKAMTIVKYREQSGAFKVVNDLLSVKGIGPATLNKNRDRIKL